MEPPQPAPPPPPPPTAYPDSLDSSPRSRTTDSWDETTTTNPKLRLMCSYGGHIVPRPHDKSLCYIGGDTRIIVVDRHISLVDLTHRLSKTLNGKSFTMKYQLPNEDLDSLISITTPEDLDNMVDEYDRLSNTTSGQKSSRLRLFLFLVKPDSGPSSFGSILENSSKSDDWFLNALNGNNDNSQRGFSESSSVNCLLGLDDDMMGQGLSQKEKGESGNKNGSGTGQDVHSVPDSPMLETTSSFGSTSSSPSLGTLPMIRVHVAEDQKVVGVEEQFSQMSVGNTTATAAAVGVMSAGFGGPLVGSGAGIGEYPTRVISDDERSEQGVMVGYRKGTQVQTQAQPQAQILSQAQMVPNQFQQKPAAAAGGFDLPSPDSVSSDGSITNPLSRQKPMIYQDQVVQIPSGGNTRVPPNPIDQNPRVQFVQVQPDSGYLFQPQFDQPLHQPQQQQQQFVHPGAQYIHHNPNAGAMPITSYYPMYHPSVYPSQQPQQQQQQQQQQQHPQLSAVDQQYQTMFYVPAQQTQAYNFSVQQPSYGEAAAGRPQMPPPAAMVPTPSTLNTTRNAPAKSEMSTGVYRTTNAAAAGPSFIQVSSGQPQPQYVGFSQIHHPSQSIPPTSAAAASANYAYEYADPTQMYYNGPLATPQLAAQYQTMTSAPTMMIPEGSGQSPTENPAKQQIRTLQP